MPVVPGAPLRGGGGSDDSDGSGGSGRSGRSDGCCSSSGGGSDGDETAGAGPPRAVGPPAPSTSTADCWKSTASSTGGPPRGRSR